MPINTKSLMTYRISNNSHNFYISILFPSDFIGTLDDNDVS
jgi:hypothetical protein